MALAVLLAWSRLFIWQRRAREAASAAWRMAILAIMQPIIATLLFMALFPPAIIVGGDTLVIATAGATLPATQKVAGRLILLPESRRIDGGAAFPDLGMALPHYPAAGRLLILGKGLQSRDLDAAEGYAISFAPGALPVGIPSLSSPPPVGPGNGFSVAEIAQAAERSEGRIARSGWPRDGSAGGGQRRPLRAFVHSTCQRAGHVLPRLAWTQWKAG